MNPNTKIIEKFYQSFAQKDYQGMAMCYHPDIHFSDPAFDLKGEKASSMWEMLCKKAKEFKLTFKDIKTEEIQALHIGRLPIFLVRQGEKFTI